MNGRSYNMAPSHPRGKVIHIPDNRVQSDHSLVLARNMERISEPQSLAPSHVHALSLRFLRRRMNEPICSRTGESDEALIGGKYPRGASARVLAQRRTQIVQ